MAGHDRALNFDGTAAYLSHGIVQLVSGDERWAPGKSVPVRSAAFGNHRHIDERLCQTLRMLFVGRADFLSRLPAEHPEVFSIHFSADLSP